MLSIEIEAAHFDALAVFRPKFVQFIVDKQPLRTLPQRVPAHVSTKVEAAQAFILIWPDSMGV